MGRPSLTSRSIEQLSSENSRSDGDRGDEVSKRGYTIQPQGKHIWEKERYCPAMSKRNVQHTVAVMIAPNINNEHERKSDNCVSIKR